MSSFLPIVRTGRDKTNDVPTGGRRASRRSGLLFALAFGVFGCSRADDQSESIESGQRRLTAAELSTLGFESSGQWSSPVGPVTLTQSSLHSEGNTSLGLSAFQYAQVRNTVGLKRDTAPVPETVSFDIRIPENTPNPWWRGAVELYIDAPSVGIWGQYLGYRSLDALPREQFTKVSFPVPNYIQTALAGNYTDLKFTIAVNVPAGSGTHYLDRFVIGPDVPPPTCVPVDDGNVCTADDCDPVTNVPVHRPVAPGKLCGDTNACNGTETCDGSGTCVAGAPPVVDDGNACTTDSCNASTGVVHAPVTAGTSCSDGNSCNGAEVCLSNGTCTAGNPPSVDDGNPCTADACSVQGGVTHTPVASGTSCSDSNPCNGVEACDATGSCVAGTAPSVDDGNSCTVDSCDATTGVKHTPLAAGSLCADSNACNGVETCDASAVCSAGTPPATDDGNPCTADSCDPVVGVVHVAVSAGTSCSDSNACNGAETCNGSGSCVAGTAPVVDDGNPCTADSCSASGGVSHVAVSAGTSCGDGNACNGAETCNGSGSCVAGTAPVVDDGNPCTADSCSASGGVSHVAVSAGTSCGDGNACNGAETCNGSGSCVAGVAPVVDDGNACTADSCDPVSGVAHASVASGTSCTDGNACNGAETCNGSGSCVAGTAPVVDDGNPCTADSCSGSGGVSHVAMSAGTNCSDSNACNGAETCNGSGSCVAGAAPVVDDGNVCTADSCDSVLGVVHLPVPVGTGCGIGDLCTGSGACDATGSCVFSAPNLDDGNPCTVDSCDPTNGVTHETAETGTPCSDGNACNGLEVCSATGSCVQGTALLLDDHNPCTVDSCDPLVGVRNDVAPVGTSCSLGTCEGTGACSLEGTCERSSPPSVADADPCTLQFCDEGSGAIRTVQCSDVSLAALSTPGGSSRFLYEGPNAVQTGVTNGALDDIRSAVVRGRVVWADGLGIPNVALSVLGRPELGQTRTQIDGQFVMVVQGSGELILTFEKEGYPSSSRVIQALPRSDSAIEDVVLVRRDHVASRIRMNTSDGQIAIASRQGDDDGERTARVYFPPGTSAMLRLPGGGVAEAPELSVRMTEYTVGDQGTARMPATLPPTSAYTYALELTADEAIAAGSENIEFNQRVYLYTDNFLGFAVGTVIPLGFVDEASGRWISVDNGSVLQVVSESAGVASLIGAEGLPPDQRPTIEELQVIAAQFEPGDTFWRAGMHHFSKWDANMGMGLPEGAGGPGGPGGGSGGGGGGSGGGGGGGGGPRGPRCSGSAIDATARTVGEELPLVGTAEKLHSTTVDCIEPGPLRIPVFGSSIPGPVQFATVDVTIAGRSFHYEVAPQTNFDIEFRWDGRDAFGRQIFGSRVVSVDVAFDYIADYEQPYRFGYAGGTLAVGINGEPSVPGRTHIQTHSRWSSTMRALDSEAIGVGGFRLAGHHFYDFEEGVLKRGTGEEVLLDDAGLVAAPAIGGGTKWPPAVGDPASELAVYALKSAFQAPNVPAYTFFRASDGSTHVAIVGAPFAAPVYYLDVDASGIVRRAQLLDRVEDGQLDAAGFVKAPNGRVFAIHNAWWGTYWGGRISELLPNGTLREVHRLYTRYVHKLVPSPDGQGLYFLDGEATNLGSATRLAYVDVAQDGCRGLFQTESEIQACYDARVVTVVGSNGTMNAPSGTNPCASPETRTAYKWNIVDVEQAHDGGMNLLMPLPVSPNWHLCKLSLNGELSDVAGIAPVDGQLRYLALSDATSPLAVGSMRADDVAGLFRLESPLPKRVALRPWRGGSDGMASGGAVLPKELNFLSSSNDLSDAWVAADGREYLLASVNTIWSVKSPLPRYGEKTVVPSGDGEEFYTFLVDGRHSETRSRATGALLRRFDYDASSKRLTAALRFAANGAASERITFERDSFGFVTGISVDPDGDGAAVPIHHTTTTGADGYITELTNPANESYSLEYEGPRRGLVTRFEYPSGRASRYTYENTGRLLTQTDVPVSGDEGTFSYVPNATSAGTSVTRTTPSGFSSVFVKNDGQADQNSGAYDYADGTSSTTSMDENSVLRRVERDGTQFTTTMTPDPETFGQSKYPSVSSVLLPESGIVSTSTLQKFVTNGSDGSVATKTLTSCQVAEGENLCSIESYASSTRTTMNTSAEGRVSTSIADALSRVIEARPAGSPRLRTVYAGDNVSAVIVDPDGVVGNADDRKTTMVYDPSTGNLSKIVDPLTHETLFVNYDGAGRPGAIVLPDTSAVAMTYDAEGNVASVTPPGKAAHEMTYGMQGRVESYTPPVGNAVGFHYDLDRRMDIIDFGGGAAVDFTYDGVTGQLSTVTSPSGTISVGYASGHMTSLVSPTAVGPITTNIEYDGMLPTSVGWSGPVVGSVNWTYNDRFLIASETIGAQSNTNVNYEYEKDGLVTSAGGLAIGRDVSSGRVTTKTVGNIRETFTYSKYGELATQKVERLSSGGAVVETLYEAIYEDGGVNGARDAMGRIVKKTERIVNGDTPVSGARALDTKVFDYGYNQAGRPWLESVAVNGTVINSYSYDANGNRIAAELTPSLLGADPTNDVSLDETETEYDLGDRLLRYGTKSYVWNDFGQLSSMTDSATNETTSYHYDLFGNLLRVDLPDGRAVEYDVDGAGRRVGRRVLDAQGNEVEFRGWIYRDLLRPIAEVDAMGNVVARYVYADGTGADQNGVKQLLIRLGANPDTSLPFSVRNVPEYVVRYSNGVASDVLRLLTNHLGTVQLVTNVATGEIVQRIDSDEFGRVFSDSNLGAQPFGFAGGFSDPLTGLVRFGARDYSPEVGRWTARDPLKANGRQSNFYIYGMSSPVEYDDPRGTSAAECQACAACWSISSIAVARCIATANNAAAVAACNLLRLGCVPICAIALVNGCDSPNPPPSPTPGPDCGTEGAGGQSGSSGGGGAGGSCGCQ